MDLFISIYRIPIEIFHQLLTFHKIYFPSTNNERLRLEEVIQKALLYLRYSFLNILDFGAVKSCDVDDKVYFNQMCSTILK